MAGKIWGQKLTGSQDKARRNSNKMEKQLSGIEGNNDAVRWENKSYVERERTGRFSQEYGTLRKHALVKLLKYEC